MVRLHPADKVEVKRLQRVAQIENNDRQDRGDQDRPDQRNAKEDSRQKDRDNEKKDNAPPPSVIGTPRRKSHELNR